VARNMAQRTANWHHLSTNVLPKLGLHVPNMILVDITNGVHRAAVLFLLQLRKTLQEYPIRTQHTSYQHSETGHSYNVEQLRLPQVQTATKQATIPPGSKGVNLSGITGVNHDVDSLAPYVLMRKIGEKNILKN
ncbi:unnamed protein product, partial [Rotaria sp. Silwood1]